MRYEPISMLEDKEVPIGSKVLFAAEREGLGYYGKYLGRTELNMFKIEIDHNKKITHTKWIVQYD